MKGRHQHQQRAVDCDGVKHIVGKAAVELAKEVKERFQVSPHLRSVVRFEEIPKGERFRIVEMLVYGLNEGIVSCTNKGYCPLCSSRS